MSKRLNRVMKDIEQNRAVNAADHVWIAVEGDDVSKVYYCFDGIEGSCFEGGQYFGVFELPDDFPFSAPRQIKMLTPNGRFIPNTSLCLTVVSSFYSSQWNASISLYKIAVMLQLYMTLPYEHMSGGLKSTDGETRNFATHTRRWNEAHPLFPSLFPHLMKPIIPTPVSSEIVLSETVSSEAVSSETVSSETTLNKTDPSEAAVLLFNTGSSEMISAEMISAETVSAQ